MIITLNEFNLIQTKDKKIGLTSGCFDLIHYYHLRYLERCKANCDLLIVGVDSDSLVEMNKKKTPVINEHHRVAMVDALKCVDMVFRMDGLDDFKKFSEVSDLIFKNSLEVYGNEVVFKDKVMVIPDIKELSSTTEIIQDIRK